MENMNEDLAFIGQMCKKIKMEMFDLQHIKVDYYTQLKMSELKKQLIQLSSLFHVEYDRIKEEFRESLPDLIVYKTNEQPLRTSDSGDYLTRMRKFDGNEREVDRVDHFENEH